MTANCTTQAHAPAPPGTGDCPHCPHPRCNGTTTRGRCCRQPVKGAPVCRTHGGGAPQVKAAAAARLQQREAVLAVETFGLPRKVDPHTALLEELHRSAGAVEWLGAVVADLERDDVVWGVAEQVEKLAGEFPGIDTTKAAKPNAWVLLWQAERKHLVDVSKACVSAGIEERRIRLAESQGQMLASVVRAVLDRLELTEPQRRLAGVVVPEEFRRVAELGGSA